MKEFIIKYLKNDNTDGHKIIKAENLEKAKDYCRINNILIKSIKENKKSIFDSIPFISKLNNNKIGYELSDEEILQFLDGIYVADQAQMRPNEAAEYMKEIALSKKMELIVTKYNEDIIAGIETSKAMSNIGMPEFITYSIRLGNEAGSITTILKKIIEMLKRKVNTQRKVKNMLVSPKITLFFLYLLFLFFLLYFFPQTKQILGFLDFNKFPEISKFFFKLSEYGISHPIIFVVSSFGIFYGFYRGVYTLIAKSIKYIPVLNKIYFYEDYIILFSLLSVAYGTNIVNYKAIEFSSAAIRNEELKNNLLQVAKKIEVGGVTFSDVAREMKLFDKVTLIFIKNTERTTKASYYFNMISEKFEQKLDDAIENSSKFINPVLLIFAASCMITLYYAANAPMFTFGMK